MLQDDLELKLLAGDPIDIGIGKVHPLTLKEIKDVGILKYNQYLSAILFDKNNIDKQLKTSNATDIDYLVAFCFYDENFKKVVIDSFECFFKEKIQIHQDGFLFFDDVKKNRVINNDIFQLIKTIIRKQNFLKEEIERDFKPANDKAKELIEKMKEVKMKLQKQNSEEGLNLSDIISIVASYSHDINIFNIWDLTVYQLYVLYIRLIMWDEYHSKYLLLPHVTDQKSLNLEHWATKINKYKNL